MPPRINLVGKKFGRLIVAAFSYRDKHRHLHWFCKCSCGKNKVINGQSLKRGDTKSCGCLHRESSASLGRANKTHGHAAHGAVTKIYRAWLGMRRRCWNENDPDFPAYGGRGITVCKRWSRFENFLKDMGEPPAGTSLDRINNDGNYRPKNCRWATSSQQSRNRRKFATLATFSNKELLLEIKRRGILCQHQVK